MALKVIDSLGLNRAQRVKQEKVRVAKLQCEAQEFSDLNSRRIDFSRNRSCSLTAPLVTFDCSLTFDLRSVRETVLMILKRLCG
jgi:hypothetical protein